MIFEWFPYKVRTLSGLFSYLFIYNSRLVQNRLLCHFINIFKRSNELNVVQHWAVTTNSLCIQHTNSYWSFGVWTYTDTHEPLNCVCTCWKSGAEMMKSKYFNFHSMSRELVAGNLVLCSLLLKLFRAWQCQLVCTVWISFFSSLLWPFKSRVNRKSRAILGAILELKSIEFGKEL